MDRLTINLPFTDGNPCYHYVDSETVKEFAERAINSLNKYCYIPRQVSFDAGFIEGIKQAQATLTELAEQCGKEEK